MDYYTYLRNMEFMNQMNNDYDMTRAENMPWPLTFQNKSEQYLLSKAIEQVKEYIIDETNASAISSLIAKGDNFHHFANKPISLF